MIGTAARIARAEKESVEASARPVRRSRKARREASHERLRAREHLAGSAVSAVETAAAGVASVGEVAGVASAGRRARWWW